LTIGTVLAAGCWLLAAGCWLRLRLRLRLRLWLLAVAGISIRGQMGNA